MPADDPYDLERFIAAQSTSYAEALREISAGAKQSHWMWFVFPQLKGLGRSPTAQFYGLVSLEEAKAYLEHCELGQRLVEITSAVLQAPASSLRVLFGSPDDMKFRSSMTLFEAASGRPETVFARALDHCCGGTRDDATLALIAQDR